MFGASIALAALSLSPLALAQDAGWKSLLVRGDAQLKLQDYPAAEDAYRSALKSVRRTVPHSPDDVVKCMVALAGVLQTQDKTEDVIPLYKKALRILQRAHGKNSRETVPVLLLLGEVWEGDLYRHRALKLYDRAVDVTASTDGHESLSCANAEHRLGRIMTKLGCTDEAQEMYGNSLNTIMKQESIQSDELLADLLNDYIDLLGKTVDRRSIPTNSYQRELLKDQIGSIEQTNGVASSRLNLRVSGQVSSPANQTPSGQETTDRTEEQPIVPPPIVPERANPDFAAMEQIQKQKITFYKRMIASDINSLGPDHPSVARDLYGLATIYLSQHKYDQAKPLFAKALRIYQQSYRAESEPIKFLQSLLKFIDEEPHSIADAGESGTGYLTGLPHVPPEAQKFEIALNLDYLALLLYSKGMIPEAERTLAWALADTAHACGEQSILVASCLNDYSKVLRSAGKQSEADKVENDAHVILKRALYKQASLALPK